MSSLSGPNSLQGSYGTPENPSTNSPPPLSKQQSQRNKTIHASILKHLGALLALQTWYILLFNSLIDSIHICTNNEMTQTWTHDSELLLDMYENITETLNDRLAIRLEYVILLSSISLLFTLCPLIFRSYSKSANLSKDSLFPHSRTLTSVSSFSFCPIIEFYNRINETEKRKQYVQTVFHCKDFLHFNAICTIRDNFWEAVWVSPVVECSR